MPQQPRSSTYLYQVAWSNPTKPRPEGFPQIILSMEYTSEPGAGARCPKEIDECWEEMHRYGYSVFCTHIPPPARQLPLASKQRIRRRNVWKWMLKKYPLFVEDFYRERIQSQPEHYGDYKVGEFADLVFYRTTLGNLKQAREATA